MEIIIRSLGSEERVTTKSGGFISTFSIVFQAGELLGPASLSFFHQDESLSTAKLRPVAENRIFEVSASVKGISNFHELPCEKESISCLEAPEAGFSFEGKIMAHWFTGEGSFFHSGQFDFLIRVEDVPPFSLEVDPGSYVGFHAKEICFWQDLSRYSS